MKVLINETVQNSIVKNSLALAALFLLINCSKAGLPGISCADGSWINEWTDAQEALSKASQAYGNDRTVENCTNYKNAIYDYLDAYENIKKCLPAATRSNLDESIQESRAEADEIDCSEG